MKRSSQVALLLMGVTGVGATGYAMTKPQNCVQPGSPAALAPAIPGKPPLQECPPRRNWAVAAGNNSSWTRTSRSYNDSASNTGGVWPRPKFSRPSTSATASSSVPLAGRTSTSTSTSPSRSTATTTTTTSRSGFGSSSSSYSKSSSS